MQTCTCRYSVCTGHTRSGCEIRLAELTLPVLFLPAVYQCHQVAIRTHQQHVPDEHGRHECVRWQAAPAGLRAHHCSVHKNDQDVYTISWLQDRLTMGSIKYALACGAVVLWPRDPENSREEFIHRLLRVRNAVTRECF